MTGTLRFVDLSLDHLRSCDLVICDDLPKWLDIQLEGVNPNDLDAISAVEIQAGEEGFVAGFTERSISFLVAMAVIHNKYYSRPVDLELAKQIVNQVSANLPKGDVTCAVEFVCNGTELLTQKVSFIARCLDATASPLIIGNMANARRAQYCQG